MVVQDAHTLLVVISGIVVTGRTYGVVIVLFIVLGNVGYFIERSRKKKDRGY